MIALCFPIFVRDLQILRHIFTCFPTQLFHQPNALNFRSLSLKAIFTITPSLPGNSFGFYLLRGIGYSLQLILIQRNQFQSRLNSPMKVIRKLTLSSGYLPRKHLPYIIACMFIMSEVHFLQIYSKLQILFLKLPQKQQYSYIILKLSHHNKIRMLRKAETHAYGLPQLSARNRSRILTSNAPKQHSLFIERVQKSVHDSEYEYLETDQISKEQVKLKELLREFNDESEGFIYRYLREEKRIKSKIPKPINPPPKSSKNQFYSKYIQNSETLLENCQKQLDKLEERCQMLKFVDLEGFQKQINQLKEDIHFEEDVNKQIKKHNTLRGRELKKENEKPDNQVTVLDHEKLFLSLKKEKLSDEVSFQQSQLKEYESMNRKLCQKEEFIQSEYKNAIAQISKRNQQNQMKENFKEKKLIYQKKKKKDSSAFLKHSYLKKLKQLEESMKCVQKINEKIGFLDLKVEQSRKQVEQYQNEYAKVKQTKKIQVIKQQVSEKEVKSSTIDKITTGV